MTVFKRNGCIWTKYFSVILFSAIPKDDRRKDNTVMNYEFMDTNGATGICNIERYSNLIVVTELAENTAMSVTNACASIATQYCKQHEVPPWDLVFFERYDERSGKTYAGENRTYASVKMNFQLDNETFYSPEWVHYDERTFNAVIKNHKDKNILEDMYEDQIIHPMPCPRCGHGSAGLATARSRRARVMICNKCGTEEAMMDAVGEYPMLFSNWAYIKVMNDLPPFAVDTEG